MMLSFVRYSCQHPCVTEFLGCAFYPARSSILIACEYMDLKSFKDMMTLGGAFPEEVNALEVFTWLPD